MAGMPTTLAGALQAIADLENDLTNAETQLALLAADNKTLRERVAALEQLAPSNERRITALEADMAAHKAGAATRQLELDRARAEQAKLRAGRR